MVEPHAPAAARVPANSLVFGFGPMLPFVAAAIGAWTLAAPWPSLAVRLAIIWGVLIAVFVAGVRRGYGFGAGRASTAAEIAAMLGYFVPAGLAAVLGAFGRISGALALLLATFVLIAIADTRAAHAGDAPAHFARLRPPQLAIAIVALAALLVRSRVHP